MTTEQYLERSGWKKDGKEWVSPFTKKSYDSNTAFNVEIMLKGRDYVRKKMEDENKETGLQD